MPDAERALRVAVVGAGPAGLYTADSLTFRFDVPVQVDLIERLPAPFGLLRYGVAPDHLNIKATGVKLHEILERPEVRLFANVEIGRDVTIEELRAHYDAVVYANGASADRALGIPGEDRAGSISATSFVGWYNGHPEREPREVLTAEAVAVIGVGNVALDVARILLKDPADLEHTDVPHDVIEVLRRSAVRDVHILGRRAAQYAKFTTKELRELGELANVDVIMVGEPVGADDPAGVTPVVRRNLAVFRDWTARVPEGRPRRLFMHFCARPVEILGTEHVSGLRIERTTPEGQGTGATEEIDVQLVLRSVGYRAVALPGLPFDAASNTVPTQDHRIVRDGVAAPGEYAVGWIKRGPTGILGTNRHDATETIAILRADLDALFARHTTDPGGIDALLTERGIRYIDLTRWLAIVDAEGTQGQPHGRSRVKLAQWDELVRAAGWTD